MNLQQDVTISFLHMSTKYHGLKYFISKHVLIGLM
jgi:hypothetical protein